MNKRAIDNAFQRLHQLQWQLKGQAIAQRNDTANPATCDAVGECVGGLHFIAGHRRLAAEEAAALRKVKV